MDTISLYGLMYHAYEMNGLWEGNQDVTAKLKNQKLLKNCQEERYEDINIKWGGYNQNKITGLTNFKVGPPEDLDATTKGRWKADIIKTLRGCIKAYLIPNQERRLRESWGKLRNCVLGSIRDRQKNEQSLVEINNSICRGISEVVRRSSSRHGRVNTKTNINNQRYTNGIPPPPQIVSTQSVVNTQEGVVEDTIGTLRRGEPYTPLNRHYKILEEGGYTDDLARLLGWAIYGCKHREKFIRRSVVKYMNMYREAQEGKFEGVKVRMKDNSLRTVKQYNRLRNLIHREESFLGTWEINIIAKLYQTQIRFFEEMSNNVDSNVTCTEQTTQTYTRVINILCMEGNRWGILKATDKGEAVPNNNDSVQNKLRDRGKRVERVKGNNISIKSWEQGGEQLVVKRNEHTQKIRITQTNSLQQITATKEQERRDVHEAQTIINTTRVDKGQGEDTIIQGYTEYQAQQTRVETEGHNDHTSIGLLGDREGGRKGTEDGHRGTNTTQNGEEEKKDSDNESISRTTTSSIAALFIDKRLESRQITEELRKKKVTRRNIWKRWKNLVRGVRRRKTRNNRRVEQKQKREIDNRKLVFDYTRDTLTEAEISLLGKGETFCVVNYKVDEDRSKVDIYKYQRRLRLHELFRDPLIAEQEIVSTPSRRRSSIRTPTRARISVRRSNMSTTNNTQSTINNRVTNDNKKERGRSLRSIYDPNSTNRNLNRYNSCIQEEIILTIQNKSIPWRDNISKAERTALKGLKEKIEKKEIIITKADKGSGLVAVQYETYIAKGTKYIEHEAKAYTQIDEEEQTIIAKLGKARNKIVDQLKDNSVIPPHTALYIKKQLEEKITGIKFYYKIHKDTNIHTMPVRPLQSCINAPTHHLSIVLTDILQPLLKTENIPTFIFDSNQLLFRLHQLGEIPSDCTIISSDVSALYPSIPHREGFRAMHTFLTEKTQFNVEQITSIMKALELVITQNYIRWNMKIYKQTSGVAMGTPVAVAYANIFMHWVDKEIRQKATYIHEHIRYIDDNLFILPTHKIDDLIDTANNILPPYIKFTYEKLDRESDMGLPFLDTQLTIAQNCTIQSRLYTKVTDRHAYILPTSYHPPHITQNIPAAVFGRIKKICSRDEWYREDAQKATTWLLDRGYKRTNILRALHKTNSKNRWEMILDIEKKRSKRIETAEGGSFQIPIVMTYNQHNNNIKKVLKQRQPLLNTAFTKITVRPRLAYRRQGNLNDIIIQKGLRGPLEIREQGTNIFTICKETPTYRTKCPCKGAHRQDKCRCCIHSNSSLENTRLKIHKPVNCNSRNIIYAIGCKKCKKKYVGETQQRLKDRLAQHMYNMDKLNQPLYLHFRYTHKLEYMYIVI